jgi:hypothetical protein
MNSHFLKEKHRFGDPPPGRTGERLMIDALFGILA